MLPRTRPIAVSDGLAGVGFDGWSQLLDDLRWKGLPPGRTIGDELDRRIEFHARSMLTDRLTLGKSRSRERGRGRGRKLRARWRQTQPHSPRQHPPSPSPPAGRDIATPFPGGRPLQPDVQGIAEAGDGDGRHHANACLLERALDPPVELPLASPARRIGARDLPRESDRGSVDPINPPKLCRSLSMPFANASSFRISAATLARTSPT